MDAEKYLKIMNKMCNSFELCTLCPNYGVVCALGKEKQKEKQVDTRKAIQIVEKWEREHPAKTRLSEFLKLFPNATLDNFGYPESCPVSYDKKAGCDCDEHDTCVECKEKFWQEEVK